MQTNSATLIYFSPTGATKKIIISNTKGMNIPIKQPIDLTSPKVRNAEPVPIEGNIVLIGVPVYAMSIPTILYPFLTKLQGNNKPAVLITVYGNLDEGIALNQLYDLTKKTGFKPVGAGSFIGEHTFSTTETPVAESRPNEKDLNKAEEFGRNVIAKLQEIKDLNDISLIIPSSKRFLIMGKIILLVRKIISQTSAVKIFAKSPVADQNICNYCGICVKLCPIAAINANTLKINKKLCLHCFSCVKRCPQKARRIVYRPQLLVSKVLAAKNRVAKEPKTYL